MKKLTFKLLSKATQKDVKQFKILVVLFLIISLFINTKCQVSDSSHLQFTISRLDSIDKLMENKVISNSLSGVEYLIADKNEIIHHQVVGFRDIEKQDKLQKNSIFPIACSSRPFVVVAVLMLKEKGLISLEDPISKYIPEFKNMKVLPADSTQELIKAKREITIYDLLVGQSGIDYIPEYYQNAGVFNSVTAKEAVLKMSAIPLTHQPGEGYQYGLTVVLEYIVELSAKMQYIEFLKQNLFLPLEMYDTDNYVSKEKRNRFAFGYTFIEKEGKLELDESVKKYKNSEDTALFYSIGIVSTASDYLKFARMLLNKGKCKDKTIISEKSVELMTSNHLPDKLLGTDEQVMDRGWGMFGWVSQGNKNNIFPKGTYGKDGGDWTSLFWLDKKNELIGIIFLQTVRNYSVIPDFYNMVYKK